MNNQASVHVLFFCAAAVAFMMVAPAPAVAADDFNPPWWVDTDGNGKRDNRDEHFLKPGESLVIGVNPDWIPPANSTSYHWHWWSTVSSFAAQGYYEEYDSFARDTWYLPDHQQNLWNEKTGPWTEASPAPMPRNWGDFDLSALLANPRWDGDPIPAGAPRGKIVNGIHGGVTWNRDTIGEEFKGVFEVPLYSDITDPSLDTTLVRLQYGGGFSSGTTYWITALEGFDDGQLVPVTRTFRSAIDGTIYYEDWQFDGSPDWIRLTTVFPDGSGMVDQVLIDTIAVPEPASLSVLGVASLVMLIRSRRQGGGSM